jgi:hypothetical protein
MAYEWITVGGDASGRPGAGPGLQYNGENIEIKADPNFFEYFDGNTLQLKAKGITGAEIGDAALNDPRLFGADVVRASALVIGNFDNLVEDPGFERSSAIGIAGGSWNAMAANQGFGISTSVFKSGAKSLSMTAGQSAGGVVNSNRLDVKTGDEFYVECQVKGTSLNAGVSAGIAIWWYNAAGGVVSTSQYYFTPTATWAIASGAPVAPANAVYADIILNYGSYTTGTIYWDDVYVHKRVITTYLADACILSAKIGLLQVNNTHINDLDAGKIKTGYLEIGEDPAGGTRPTFMAVFDGAQNVVAWIGKKDVGTAPFVETRYGLFAQNGWFGGTVSAPFITLDSTACKLGGTALNPIINLNASSCVINGATFELNLNGVKTKIQNFASGSDYVGVEVSSRPGTGCTSDWYNRLSYNAHTLYAGDGSSNGFTPGVRARIDAYGIGGGVTVYDSAASESVRLDGFMHALKISGVQVVGARIATRATTLQGVIDALVTHGLMA